MRIARYMILLGVGSLSSNATSIYGTYTLDYTAQVDTIEDLNPAFDVAVGDTFKGYITFSVTTELVANSLRFEVVEQSINPVPGTNLWTVISDLKALTVFGWDPANNDVVTMTASAGLTSMNWLHGGGGFSLDAYYPQVTSSRWAEWFINDGYYNILRGTIVDMTLRETPEPGSLTVVAAGLLAVIGFSRKRL